MTYRAYSADKIYAGFNDLPKWKVKVSQALAAAISDCAAGLPHRFEETLWQALKPYLILFFAGRCAYCEATIVTTDFGHVEHYRPKKKVTDEPTHPGYYWTAYEPMNLLLSCARCNSGDGIGGKKNFFPVEDGTRAFTSADTPLERPVLLNPYFDNVADHLEFEQDHGSPTGFLRGRTPRGAETIRICGLNRIAITEDRLEAQRHSVLAFKEDGSRASHLKKLVDDRFDYPAARWSAIESWWKHVDPTFLRRR
jgi:uncharacterized protein (TIGR02646 family)